MMIKTIQLELRYYVENEDENRLVIDAAVQAASEARAVAQTLLMTAATPQPPPRVVLQVTDAKGRMDAIDLEQWQAMRAEQQEAANG